LQVSQQAHGWKEQLVNLATRCNATELENGKLARRLSYGNVHGCNGNLQKPYFFFFFRQTYKVNKLQGSRKTKMYSVNFLVSWPIYTLLAIGW
jgi:hypothetical protein